MAAFERFLHSDTQIPALVKIGLAHAQFETIHPFRDGNGRVGRLLITFLLCEKEILSKPLLYISHYFRKNQEMYYRLLQRTRDEGDLESWLNFFLEGIAQVSNEATDTARRIVDLRENHRDLIVAEFGRSAGNGITLMEELFQRPIIQVNDVVNILGVSFTSANSLMGKFVEHGLVSEITGQVRNRRFRYSPYIELFSNI